MRGAGNRVGIVSMAAKFVGSMKRDSFRSGECCEEKDEIIGFLVSILFHLSKHEYVKFLIFARRSISLAEEDIPLFFVKNPTNVSWFATEFPVRVSEDLVTERRDEGWGRQRRMINLKAEVKKRASRMIHGAVGRGRSHNGEYRGEGATAIFVGRAACR